MSVRAWNQPGFLDAMRQEGDPPTDWVVEQFANRDGRNAVKQVLKDLIDSHGAPPPLTGELASYFNQLPDIPDDQQRAIIAGQTLFEEYGPEIMLVLACYSLPECYVARKGVQVLSRTGLLQQRPNRRLFQTAQMLIEMLSADGLAPNGIGCRTARKIRILHGLNRFLIRTDASWDPSFDLPINQEDLAGTFTAFTAVILDGLRKLRIDVPDERAHAYLRAWQAIGRLLGLREELIPANVDEAFELKDVIARRQFFASDEGTAITRALLKWLAAQSPFYLPRLPGATVRFMLGNENADKLKIPNAPLEAALLNAGIVVGHAIDEVLGGAQRRRLFRRFGMNLLKGFIAAELQPHGPQIRVSSHLRRRWSLPEA